MSINEKQLGPITVLDKDGYSGFVDASESLIINMSGLVINEQSDSPAPGTDTTGTLWARDDGYLVFTNQDDFDTVLGAASPGGEETLAETLVFGNTTGGKNIEITDGDILTSESGSSLTIQTQDLAGVTDNIEITSGTSSSNNTGNVVITGGDSGGSGPSGTAGSVNITGGSGPSGTGGSVNLTGGSGLFGGGVDLKNNSGSSNINIGTSININANSGSSFQINATSADNVTINAPSNGGMNFVPNSDVTLDAPDDGNGFIITAKDATTSNTVGGSFDLNAGVGNGTGQGGNFQVLGGQGGTNGDGGIVNIRAGAGQGTGNGGDWQLLSGDSGSGATGNAGTIFIQSGNALSTDGSGGFIDIDAGSGTGTQPGGSFIVNGGDSVDGLSGQVLLSAGNTSGIGSGGSATLIAGNSNAGAGGILIIEAGNADTGGTGSNAGGDLNVTAGNSEDGPGGDIIFTPGTAAGTGTEGAVIAKGISGERIQLSSTQLSNGTAAATGGTLTLVLPAVTLNNTETYNIRVKTLTGSTYDYYRGACIVQRDGTGTLINRLDTVSEFTDPNFVITATEASDIVTITFTNNSGTVTDDTTITANIESEDIPA